MGKFRKGLGLGAGRAEDVAADDDEVAFGDYWKGSCIFCYAEAPHAVLSRDAKLPSRYSNEMKSGKKGDKICGECLGNLTFWRKIEEAKRQKPLPPIGSGTGYGYGYREYLKPETVRGKKVFGKREEAADEEKSS